MVMLNLVRDNPIVTMAVAYVRTRLEPMRETNDRGASAVEWAIIAAICVVAALAIGVAVNQVVTNGNTNITKGNTLPGPGGGK
jgi:Flp pilus assembly pilin Flp